MELAAQVLDLKKHFLLGTVTVEALRGVTIDFPKGDFVAIMGSSGSGKSTLLNLLGALDRPTYGKYIIGGKDVSVLSDDQLSSIRNEMIGFIFQSYNLIPQYTVLENIEVPLHYRARYPSIGTKEKSGLNISLKWSVLVIAWIIALFSCPEVSSSVSRLHVRLVNNPEIILADEPTGNLDSKTEHEIMEMLLNLNREGRTIIMVTHEPNVAKLAKRRIFMRDGVVAGEGIFPG